MKGHEARIAKLEERIEQNKDIRPEQKQENEKVEKEENFDREGRR